MKKTLSYLLLASILSIPTISQAATKTVTINWTMADTTNVQSYKMYYSYNNDMSNKMLACETNDTAATTLTCADVFINSYPVYFSVASVTTDEEISSTAESVVSPIAVVQDFMVITPDGAVSQVVSGRATEGMLLLYDFHAGAGNIVYDISNVGSPMNLSINNTNNVSWLNGGGLSVTQSALISSSTDTKISSACKASNEITIEAWIEPANTTQSGPARIITLSQDGSNRNFTLGQNTSAYDVRLRTTTTGNNGNTPSTTTGNGVVETSISHIVYTRNASGIAKIYKNGIEITNATISGNFSNWNSSYRFALANELTSDRTWLGEFYLVAVYERALTAEEITNNFEAGL